MSTGKYAPELKEIPNPKHQILNKRKENLILLIKIQMTQSVTRSLRVPTCRGEAISVEGGGDMCIHVVAGFIPALWSAKRKLPCE